MAGSGRLPHLPYELLQAAPQPPEHEALPPDRERATETGHFHVITTHPDHDPELVDFPVGGAYKTSTGFYLRESAGARGLCDLNARASSCQVLCWATRL